MKKAIRTVGDLRELLNSCDDSERFEIQVFAGLFGNAVHIDPIYTRITAERHAPEDVDPAWFLVTVEATTLIIHSAVPDENSGSMRPL